MAGILKMSPNTHYIDLSVFIITGNHHLTPVVFESSLSPIPQFIITGNPKQKANVGMSMVPIHPSNKILLTKIPLQFQSSSNNLI